MTRDPKHPETVPQSPQADLALDALLDEALAPDPVPTGLNDRLYRATAPQLRATHRPVLARIGGNPGLRIAAAMLIAAGVISLAYVDTRPPTTPDPGSGRATLHLTQLDALNAVADAAHNTTESIDLQIETLGLHVAMTDHTDPWAEPGTEYDDLALETELDLLGADFNLLF